MQNNKRKKKILFISEALSAPFDEGIKNVTYSLHKQFQKKVDALTVTKAENVIDDKAVMKVALNKLFLNNKLRKIVRVCSPDIILYLPEASTTIASFLRAKMLKLMNWSSSVVILGIQHRTHNRIKEFLFKYILNPDMLLILGESDKRFFTDIGIRVSVLPPAVDLDKFHEASQEEKGIIRQKYNIPIDKTIILHVGHIKVNRNIDSL